MGYGAIKVSMSTALVIQEQKVFRRNQIEIWFGIINRKLLRRKSYLSIEELKESIKRFIEQYNLVAHPFKWTYTGIPLTI